MSFLCCVVLSLLLSAAQAWKEGRLCCFRAGYEVICNFVMNSNVINYLTTVAVILVSYKRTLYA